MKNKTLYKNTFMLYLMTAAKYILPLVTLPYLTRVLEPDGYGIITYMTAMMTYFQLFVDFGFNYSATKVASENRDNRTKLSLLLGDVIAAKIVLVIISAVFLFILIPYIAILKENILLTYLYFSSVLISIFLPDYIYRGIEKMEIITVRYVIAKLISAVLILVFVKDKSDLLWIPVLYTIGTGVAVAFSWYHVLKKLNLKLCWLKLHNVWSTLKDSGVYFVAVFATTAFSATNIILMGFSSITTQEIAYWGVAYQVITAIQALYDPIISSVYPHMVAKRDYGLIKKILMFIMPVIIMGIAVSYWLADLAIYIVAGSGYSAAAPIFCLLLPVLFFSFPAQLLGFPVLGTMGKEKLATRATIISATFHGTGLVALFISGSFTLINIAILRSCTEAALCLFRVIFVIAMRYMKH
ncbi:MAG: hypothetical protein VR69_02745 [Peptococcaceae bacterium BRH_c4b]|nr:MAG: hypothetical protein VR69_02745 [Peptococcaceae bacterium BRH_c4b]